MGWGSACLSHQAGGKSPAGGLDGFASGSRSDERVARKVVGFRRCRLIQGIGIAASRCFAARTRAVRATRPTSYRATVPDLPGCVAVGETLEEVESFIREAIEFHIKGLHKDGLPVPPPTTICEYVEAPVA